MSLLPWDYYRRPFAGSFWLGDLHSEDDGEDYFTAGGDFERMFGFDLDTKLGAILETSPIKLSVPALLDRLEISHMVKAAVIERANLIGFQVAHAILYIRHFAYHGQPAPNAGDSRLHFVCWVPMPPSE